MKLLSVSVEGCGRFGTPGGVIFLIGHLGAGGAKVILRHDPCTAPVAVLASWTWLAKSSGMLTL